jgi:hypothetical protein
MIEVRKAGERRGNRETKQEKRIRNEREDEKMMLMV